MVETADFGPNPGALRMLSHAPAGLPKGAPLVVVLHGCTQTAEAFAADAGWLALADRYGFAVVAPEQNSQNNPNRCFTWFSSGDITRGEGEAASVAAMTAHAIATYQLEPERVFVSGLSAGGAMAAVMLAAYPDIFAGGAIIAGLPYGVAGNVGQAMMAMRGSDRRDASALGALARGASPQGGRTPRVSIWHGAADHTVNPANAEASAGQWAWMHGLAVEPDETWSPPGRSHSVWRSPEGGQVMIEKHLIAGLGHGTPLAVDGPDGAGAVAPYMLEAGVSSSLESLRFWGLAPPAADPPAEQKAAKAAAAAAAAAAEGGLAELVMRSVSGHVSGPVHDLIAKALRSAGLK
ncbi:PHB depolymerase family esterase [Phenylobacterium sp.]|uniref:extracellular catalytic domain type 1 short-chain-length polyhydroxyalkanoate depolymerase n=1 Tax=Phenylobacterium sp. TaxID=1871053 RepID=UPI00272FDD96|nr:PHB depolymerase family esterase [Phenylobacterium sp.]MDP2213541.1 PHB depolymerase family esterase [Phenylobacterium sp.]